jgi:uncharacterized protein (UPF0335 family)
LGTKDIEGEMNKKSNLFLSLFKHRPESERSSKENFLTEVFAFILRLENGTLLKFLLKKILKETKGLGSINTQDFQVDTFRPVKIFSAVNYKYVDVCLTSEKITVYIENKIESGINLSKNKREVYKPQTEFYKEHLISSEYDKCKIKKLVTITKYPQEKGKEDIAILWEDVYRWIDEWLRKLPNKSSLKLSKEIIFSFLQFLEELDMKPIRFSNKDVEVGKRFIELDKGVRQVLNYVVEQIQERYRWSKKGKISYSVHKNKIEYYWGSPSIKTQNNISFRFYLYLYNRGWEVEVDFPFTGNKKSVNKIRKRLINTKYNYSEDAWEIYKSLKLPRDFCKYESKKQKKIILKTIIAEIEKLTRGKGRLLEI